MPYIFPNDETKLTKTDRRTKLKANPVLCESFGDLNYVYTLAILKEWKKNPKYETIHKLYKSLFFDVEVLPEIQNLNVFLWEKWDDHDLAAAKGCAWTEVYGRLFARYEEQAIEKNGDLSEMIEAFDEF